MVGSFWEDGEVPNLQGGSIQHVVVAHEARVDRPLQHQECLGRVRVGVDGEDAADAKVEPEVRDTLSVHAGKLIHGREFEISICASDGRIGRWWNIMDIQHTIDVRGSCMFWHQQYIYNKVSFFLFYSFPICHGDQCPPCDLSKSII